MNNTHTAAVVAGLAVGVIAVPALASALVPVAMKTFGVVITGVGTMHAAGGVAATLQKIAAASLFL